MLIRATSLVLFLLSTLQITVAAQELEESLFKAARKGQFDAVWKLLDQGASINAVDNKGRTALMLAAGEERADVVWLLVRRGADVHLTDKKGKTAYDQAKSKYGVVGELLDRATKPQAKPRPDFFADKVVEKVDGLLMEADYLSAKGINSVDAFEHFRQRHPNSELDEAVQGDIKALRYTAASSSSQISEIDAYLIVYSIGDHTEDEQRNLEDRYWLAASSGNDPSSFNNYVRLFPNGVRVDDAKARLRELEEPHWGLARKSTSIDSVLGFIREFPDSKHLPEAYEAVEILQREEWFARVFGADNLSVSGRLSRESIKVCLAAFAVNQFGLSSPATEVRKPVPGSVYVFVTLSVTPLEDISVSSKSDMLLLDGSGERHSAYALFPGGDCEWNSPAWDVTIPVKAGHHKTLEYAFMVPRSSYEASRIVFKGKSFPL